MDFGLKDKVALITASSKGLGKSAALALAQEGASVVLCARTAAELEAAAQEISEQTGAHVLAIPADVSHEDDIRTVVKAAVDRFGRLDVLVTNAGGPPSGSFEAQDDAAWHRAFELNLLSVVHLIRECLPYLKESGRGRIINFSSTAVKQPISGLILSNSLRSAVIGMAKTLSFELAPFGITVNNIAPGRFDTDRIRGFDETSAAQENKGIEEIRARQQAQLPLGRYGDPIEMGYLTAFLASDKAGYITGTTIQIDGGLVIGLL